MVDKSVIKYLNRLYESESPTSTQKKIVDFFKKNTKPADKQIHAFAEAEGIEIDKFEEIVYELIGTFLGEGKSKGFIGSYDPEQLKMGIKVEMEHTTNPLIAEKIANDHLAEFSDYYTRLEEMEKKAKAEGSENT